MSSNWNVACLRVSVLVLYCLGCMRVSSLRLPRLICLKFIVTKVYIYFSRNLKSDLLLEKAWKIAYRIFVWGCWMTVLNWMTTKLNFSFLAHRNSLKRSTPRVSAWLTLTFIPFPLQGISVHDLTLGFPCRSILQRSAVLHFFICTIYDASGIVHFRVRCDRWIKEVKTHFLQP